MLKFKDLSFWERSSYLDDIDFTIVGSGIVGLTTSLFLKSKFPNSKILIIERGYLPTGASTKNAGFACFGSPTELFDDLKNMEEKAVWDTFSFRYEGLKTLFEIIPPSSFDFNPCSSWDLIQKKENDLSDDFIDYINEKTQLITGEHTIYSKDDTISDHLGFKNIYTSFKNRLEGSIHTGKLIQELYKKVVSADIKVLFGLSLKSFESHEHHVWLDTNYGEFKSNNLVICTNGFAKQFLKEDILPARAQVVITKPISNLKINGTFHLESGYYYFRNVQDRILLGGGRNLDFAGETTENIETSQLIQNKLYELLSQVILPNTQFEIDYSWAGIMGVGNVKKPIILKTNKNVAFGVRMGGMGVAIGSEVGRKLANLF